MIKLQQKQPVLKPQDLLVVLKITVNEDRGLTFAELGDELSMSASEVHAATKRAEMSRLLIRESGQLHAVRSSLQEFLLHGVKYVFPAFEGGITRGIPTGISAPPLKKFFAQNEAFSLVWPDAQGDERGLSLLPLYPSVPLAARADFHLYEILVIVDTLRGAGTAREREIATSELMSRLI
jgi:hypothetical protein